MPVSDLDCARLCWSLYNEPNFSWDDLLLPAADDGICVAVKRIGAVAVVVFRGSVSPQDWFRDFESELFHELPSPFDALGDVAVGFGEGMVDLFHAKMMAVLDTPWMVTGHSLGAARASLFAGMGIAAGKPPIRRVAFGPPRVGCGDFAHVMSRLNLSPLYRNREDPVCDVPTSPPFEHDRALTPLDAKPLPGDPWGLLAAHHIELYVDGLGGAGQMGYRP